MIEGGCRSLGDIFWEKERRYLKLYIFLFLNHKTALRWFQLGKNLNLKTLENLVLLECFIQQRRPS